MTCVELFVRLSDFNDGRAVTVARNPSWCALHPYPRNLAIVSKVGGSGPDGLRQGIEQNLVTLGVDRLAAVNLRHMDPSEPPGGRFEAQVAALVRARADGLIDGVGPDRARVAAGHRPERAAHPGHAHPRPSC